MATVDPEDVCAALDRLWAAEADVRWSMTEMRWALIAPAVITEYLAARRHLAILEADYVPPVEGEEKP